VLASELARPRADALRPAGSQRRARADSWEVEVTALSSAH
jgi:hypothetical protein